MYIDIDFGLNVLDITMIYPSGSQMKVALENIKPAAPA
jgi:hypothetical protein